MPIFEDECYSDLIWSGERPPAIYALDDTGRTIFTSTFSKSIAPAIRVGYLVAKWPFLSRAIACKTDAGSGMIEQMMLAEFCPDSLRHPPRQTPAPPPGETRHPDRGLEREFRHQRRVHPSAGRNLLWLRLPEEVDTTRLTQVAAAKGIAINPGVEWSEAHPAGNRHIRVCFASATPDEIRAGIEALADVCHDTFGVPVRSANRAR